MAENKRRSARKPFRKVAKVVQPGGKPASCVVVDRSEHGAMLFFDQVPALPDTFELRLSASEVLAVRVVRRAGRYFGIEFTG